MSLQPHSVAPVPHETVRIARAAFPRGNMYLRMRDELGSLFEDPFFAPLFPARGQPAMPRVAWLWSPFSNLLRDYPMRRRRMPCGAGLTGSMR